MSISLPSLPSIPTLSDYTAARDALFEMLTKLSTRAVQDDFQIGVSPPLTVAGTSPPGANLNAASSQAAVLQNGVVSLGLQVPLSPHYGGTGGGAMTPGSVVFAGASGVYYQDNSNFFWDSFYHRLGIGTPAPSQMLHLVAPAASVAIGRLDAASGKFAGFQLYDGNTGNSWAVGHAPTASAATLLFAFGNVGSESTKVYFTSTGGATFADTVVAPLFSGPLSGAVTGNVTGNVTGSSGSCTGNAATATTATTATNAGALATNYVASVYGSVSTSLTSGSSTQLTFGTELSDPNNNFATNAYTVPVTGWYAVAGCVSSPQTSGILYASLYDSTASAVVVKSALSSAATTVGASAPFSGVAYLTASHVLVVYGYQNTGGPVSTSNTADSTFLRIHYLGA